MTLSLKEEKKLWKKGFKFVVGLDEAGRGAGAGPVVAGAVLIKKENFINQNWILKVKDSKKLSGKKRKEFFQKIKNSNFIVWAWGKVCPKTVDKMNVLEATKLAMKRALNNLIKKNQKIDFLILDGKMKLDFEIPQKSIIKADEKILSCALASIIAKIKRDGIMEKLAQIFPEYNFQNNKGYLTKEHLKMIRKYGLCKIHRKSFKLRI